MGFPLCQIEGQPTKFLMKRSSKKFVICSNKENSKGFSVDPNGIDLVEYLKNPLMLWMHQRPTGKSKDEVLPIGNWVDLKVEDGKLTGYPAFDESDPFAMALYHKVENGTIRMASAGLKPRLWTEVDSKKILSRSAPAEISLVDIGSDPDALAVVLYDESENLIELSQEYLDMQIPQPNLNQNMKLIQLSADILPLIGLAEGAKPEDVQAKIGELVTLADTQKTTIETLTAEKTAADKKAEDIQAKLDAEIKLASETKIIALVDKAVEDRKITADQKPHFVKLATADLDSATAVLNSMPSNPTVKSQVEKEVEGPLAELVKLSWGELDKANKLTKLKDLDLVSFKAKYKEKFGTEYPGA